MIDTDFLLLNVFGFQSPSLKAMDEQIILGDYKELNGSVYIYVLLQGKIIEEIKMEQLVGV